MIPLESPPFGNVMLWKSHVNDECDDVHYPQ